MKATLVFQSHESCDISVGMVFIPCLCWVVGNKIISNPHPKYPQYLKGDFQFLIENKIFKYTLKKSKKLVLVVHYEGHGSQEDIDLLVKDINESGFDIQLARFL